MAVLRRDYLPGEIEPRLKATQFDGTIAVQARQVVEETEWLLELSDNYDFIKGVVGWVDLRSPKLRVPGPRTSWREARAGVTRREVAYGQPWDRRRPCRVKPSHLSPRSRQQTDVDCGSTSQPRHAQACLPSSLTACITTMWNW